MRCVRVESGPLVCPGMDASLGDNVNGPSLVRVPDFVERALGRYYLYFAHHDGRHIRLAYADDLHGPWRIHPPGVMNLAASGFAGHVASPDVHVDAGERRLRMYFHGSDTPSGDGGEQATRVALSGDGVHFEAREPRLGRPYFRVMRLDGWYFAVSMPGQVYRSRDGLDRFEPGPMLGDGRMRHLALRRHGRCLEVFHTRVGDRPERIVVGDVDLDADWTRWRMSAPREVLRPERDYEGADCPLVASRRGMVTGRAHQLRDPCVFREDGRTWLLYAVAGEHGIAMAELIG